MITERQPLAAMSRIPRAARKFVLSLVLAALGGACEPARSSPARRQVPGGQPSSGRAALGGFGCGGCHFIPGIPGATGLVASPLTDFGRRAFVGGVVANNSENLVAWIMDPPALSPRTAMPKLGVPEAEARHMAAYLYAETALRQ